MKVISLMKIIHYLFNLIMKVKNFLKLFWNLSFQNVVIFRQLLDFLLTFQLYFQYRIKHFIHRRSMLPYDHSLKNPLLLEFAQNQSLFICRLNRSYHNHLNEYQQIIIKNHFKDLLLNQVLHCI